MRKLKRNHKAYASWASSKYNNNLKFIQTAWDGIYFYIKRKERKKKKKKKKKENDQLVHGNEISRRFQGNLLETSLEILNKKYIYIIRI